MLARNGRGAAVVSGAGSGIGRAVALMLAGTGFDLVLVGRREEMLLSTARPLEKMALVDCIAGDLLDPKTSERVRDCLLYCWGLVHTTDRIVLVNSVGTAEFGPFVETSVDSIRAQIEVNSVAPLLLCHALLPHMLRVGGGDIVNISSVAALTTLANSAAYSAGKAALHSASKVLAAECRGRGVRITSLLLGATDTPLWDNQSFVPDRKEMISSRSVAETVRSILNMPADCYPDELLLTPPKGVL
nr:SDR family NAD(P)-dependent oxidoreductase [Fimbriimonas ginsengisoli]